MIELASILLIASAALFGMRSAYRNGVTDGYGYSREKNNPGYANAGRYLITTMAHRWPELTEDDLNA